MEKKNRTKEDRRTLDCAFARFFALRYPFCVDTRLYESTHRIRTHNHDFPQLWYCLNGEYLHYVEDKVYTCGKGSLVLIPPSVFHKFSIPEGGVAEIMSVSVMYDIFLDTPPERYTNAVANLFLPSFAKELGYSVPTYLQLGYASQAAFENITSWLSSTSTNLPAETTYSDIYDKLEQLNSLPELAIPEKYREKTVRLAQTRLRPILRALSYLNTHYPHKIVEEDLLQAAAICHTDLYRYFKRFTGYTFSGYLQRLRTQRADTYLLNTSFSLSYISDICGFSDSAHMSRIYTKYMGATPRVSRIERRKLYGMKPEYKLQMPKF